MASTWGNSWGGSTGAWLATWDRGAVSTVRTLALRGSYEVALTASGSRVASFALLGSYAVAHVLEGDEDVAIYNSITLYCGEAVSLAFAITGSPDMSAWSIRFCLLSNQGDNPAAALVTRTVGSGVTASGGTVTVTLTSAQLDRAAGPYTFTLARTDTAGMLAYGDIALRPPRVV